MMCPVIIDPKFFSSGHQSCIVLVTSGRGIYSTLCSTNGVLLHFSVDIVDRHKAVRFLPRHQSKGLQR